MQFVGVTAQVVDHIWNEYGVAADFPWENSENAVFRHGDSRKWFAIIMCGLSGKALGRDEKECCDVMNLKCDPRMIGALLDGEYFFPAYHMNKEHWLSVRLAEGVPLEEVFSLIAVSHGLTAKRK